MRSYTVALVVLVAACRSHTENRRVELDPDDPCRYLAATEAVPYVGSLAAPPYRFDDGDGVPRASGTHCLYRGQDGRSIMVDVMTAGARDASAVVAGVPRVTGRVLKSTGDSEHTGMLNGMSQKGQAGPWDNATWTPIGKLIVAKGDEGFIFDVSASTAGETGAYALARDAFPRLGAPLSYDGAAAAASAPKPHAVLANPCDLVSRAKVEQAIGPLAGDPESDSASSKCTYRVATSEGTREYPLDITWTGGYKELVMLQGSVAMAGTAMGKPSSANTAPPSVPPEAQKMIGQFTKVLAGSPTSAPPQVPLTPTDTTPLIGPWDKAAAVGGQRLAAVRHDVLVQIILTTADPAKARALLAAACEQL